jgi:hypothetical protein
MTNFRICGLIVAAATLVLATVAQAAVIVAPLESGTSISKVAQGCGPGGWRGPYGRCHYRSRRPLLARPLWRRALRLISRPPRFGASAGRINPLPIP